MRNYRIGRILASAIIAAGWGSSLLFVFFFIFRLVRTGFSTTWAGSAVPFLLFAFASLSLVLFGCIARAIFDIAEKP